MGSLSDVEPCFLVSFFFLFKILFYFILFIYLFLSLSLVLFSLFLPAFFDTHIYIEPVFSFSFSFIKYLYKMSYIIRA